MSLSWTPELSVNNEEIDQQHQALIAMINALPADSGDGVVTRVEQLLERCFGHFKAEEEWMRTLRYPGYREHLQCHNRLGEEFHALFRDYNLGRIDHDCFLRSLRERVTEHILEEDAKIAAFVNPG